MSDVRALINVLNASATCAVVASCAFFLLGYEAMGELFGITFAYLLGVARGLSLAGGDGHD
jgi:hypothetical protein